MDIVSSTLKDHPAFLYSEELKDICRPLQQLNISIFSHVRSKNATIAGFNTNPLCMENYLKKKYYQADIHMDKNHCHLLNCLMWDNIEARGLTAHMLQDAAELQYNHIFTIIKEQDNQLDYYHFGTHIKNPAINQLYVNHYDLLEQFIGYFNTRIAEIPHLASMYNILFELEPQKPLLTDDDSFFIHKVAAQKESFLKEINLIKQTPNSDMDRILKLTPRELEYIPYIMRGYTAKEIGSIFGVSYRTVEVYIAGLKKKWHVKNKAALIGNLCAFYQKNLDSGE